MKRRMALLLSFILLFSLLTPFAYAEEVALKESDTAVKSEVASKASDVPVKSSENFKDLNDLSDDEKKKVNALIQASVFNGVSADTFGWNQKMNRAQFAKAAASIFSLKVDNTLTQSSFADVTMDDPANSYALPYIEALKQGGLTNGYDAEGKRYNPSGEVSRQELAVFLIRGLGLEEAAKAAEPVQDETVSNWAKSYVALALEKQIFTNSENGKFDGNLPATRNILVMASYEAMQLHLAASKPAATPKPDKVSIVEVKMIGTSKLSVKLNRDVDINKAILTVTKYGLDTAMSATTIWSDDDTNATLEMDVLTYGKYQVILSGLDAVSIENGKMEIMPEVEQVKSLEIVTSTETLPMSKTMIEFKAKNQYNEDVKLLTSDLQIAVNTKNQTVVFNPGEQFIVIDLSNEVKNSIINVSMIEKRSSSYASKTFTVGEAPMVTKIEMGELKLPGGQLIFKAGVRAYLAFKAYDQYGNRIIDPQLLNGGIIKNFTVDAVLRNDIGQNDFIDFDNDGYPELQLVANRELDSDKEVTVNMFSTGNGQKVSKTVQVTALKTPATVVIKPLEEQLVEGGKTNTFGLIVKDSTGYEFTPAEIADAETTGKISVFSTGGIVLGATPSTRVDPTTGVVREVAITIDGAIQIKSVTASGPATVNVRLNALNQTATLPIIIGQRSKPISIKLHVDSTANVTMFPGIEPKSKFVIYDQYGLEYNKDLTPTPDYRVQLKLEKISGDTGALKETKKFVLNDTNPTLLKELKDIQNQEITYVPHETLKGSYRVTALLVKVDSSGLIIQETLDSLSVALDVVDKKKADLVYNIDFDGSLLAAGRLYYDFGNTKSVTDATYLFGNASYNLAGKDIVIKVRDSSGYAVSDTPTIKWVTSSKPNVVAFNNNAAKPRIIGINAGRATVKVYFDTPLGQKDLTIEVVVAADPMEVLDIKFKNATPKTVSSGSTVVLNGLFIWDSKLMSQFSVQTNFGTFLNQNTQDQITPVNNILSVYSWISDIVYTEADTTKQDTISLGTDFKISYTRKGSSTTNNIKQFTIYSTAFSVFKPYVVILQ